MINYNKIVIFLEKYSVQDYLRLTDLLSEFKIEPVLNDDETEFFIDLWKILKIGDINRWKFIKRLLNIIEKNTSDSTWNILIRELDLQDYSIKEKLSKSLTREIGKVRNNIGFFRTLGTGSFCFFYYFKKSIFNDFENIYYNSVGVEAIYPRKSINVKNLKLSDFNLLNIVNDCYCRKEFLDSIFMGILIDNSELETALFKYLNKCNYIYDKI